MQNLLLFPFKRVEALAVFQREAWKKGWRSYSIASLRASRSEGRPKLAEASP